MPDGQAAGQEERILRFTLSDRIEHWLQVITFVALAFTGLIQKWPEMGFSQWAITTLGGIETTRFIHRVFATMLLLAIVYHLFAAGKRIFVDRARRTMIPGRADVRAAWQALQYNLGRRRERPQQGRFTWEEKLEYWAIVWGTVVMTVTGFMLWNPVATAGILPGQFIPAAKAAHGGEALLAVLAILVWHVYHVHFRNFNRSIFTGYMSRKEMEEEHPLELAAIEAGETAPPPVEVTEQRRRLFVPFYSVVAAMLLVGIYFFVTFEETAIQTIKPPEDVTIFVPAPTTTVPLQTTTTGATTTSTTAPGTPVSWDTTIGPLFAAKCGGCHTGGAAFGGLDLSGFVTALEGGASGPGIVRGDPDASVIYSKQTAGGHAGQLTGDELATLKAWIEDDAPVTAADAGGTPASSTTTTGAAGGAPMTPANHEGRTSCLTCHATGLAGAPVVPVVPDHSSLADNPSVCTACHRPES